MIREVEELEILDWHTMDQSVQGMLRMKADMWGWKKGDMLWFRGLSRDIQWFVFLTVDRREEKPFFTPCDELIRAVGCAAGRGAVWQRKAANRKKREALKRKVRKRKR